MTSDRRTVAGALLLAAVLLAGPPPAAAAVFRDALGREISLPSPPERIVSLAPNLTEILFALGLGERVAGVTSFCDFPPAAREKPRVGGFVNPSHEAITALEPDLVLATADGNRAEDVHRLEALGLTVYVTDSRSVEEIFGTVVAVGRLTGREAPAHALADSLRRRRDAVHERVSLLAPVTVFVALDINPLITAGQETFVGELVSLAGGENIVTVRGEKYPVFSMERLVAADPAVILTAAVPAGKGAAAAAAALAALPGGASLRAVRTGRVFPVGEGSFFRPGPRIIDSLDRLVRYLHGGEEGG